MSAVVLRSWILNQAEKKLKPQREWASSLDLAGETSSDMGLRGPRRSSQHAWRMAIESRIPWLENAAPGARWLAGISGGADSVALLHLLHRHGFRKVVVCHLDHRLRGRASTADARFVEKLADRLGYPCESAAVDVRGRMKGHGESMETAARHTRHEFFAECAAKFRCRRILLAHHADDQAETVLWNLLRGSHGLRGMRGEQEIRIAGKPLRIIRPLLELRRTDHVRRRPDVLRPGSTRLRPRGTGGGLGTSTAAILPATAPYRPFNSVATMAEDCSASCNSLFDHSTQSLWVSSAQ